MPARYGRARKAGEMLDCHEKSIWRLVRDDPKFPRPVHLGKRHTVFDLDAVAAWAESKRDVEAAA